jgi:hypothetical protein
MWFWCRRKHTLLIDKASIRCCHTPPFTQHWLRREGPSAARAAVFYFGCEGWVEWWEGVASFASVSDTQQRRTLPHLHTRARIAKDVISHRSYERTHIESSRKADTT